MEGLDQIEADRLFSALESHIEMQFEARFEEAEHLLTRQLLFFSASMGVQDQKLGNQVKENKHTRSGAEGNVSSLLLHLEAAAHRAFDVEGLTRVENHLLTDLYLAVLV